MKPNYERLAEFANKQDNVVTRKQLLALRFSDDRVDTMVARKHWLQLQRGVYLLGPGPARGANSREQHSGPEAPQWHSTPGQVCCGGG